MELNQLCSEFRALFRRRVQMRKKMREAPYLQGQIRSIDMFLASMHLHEHIKRVQISKLKEVNILLNILEGSSWNGTVFINDLKQRTEFRTMLLGKRKTLKIPQNAAADPKAVINFGALCKTVNPLLSKKKRLETDLVSNSWTQEQINIMFRVLNSKYPSVAVTNVDDMDRLKVIKKTGWTGSARVSCSNPYYTDIIRKAADIGVPIVRVDEEVGEQQHHPQLRPDDEEPEPRLEDGEQEEENEEEDEGENDEEDDDPPSDDDDGDNPPGGPSGAPPRGGGPSGGAPHGGGPSGGPSGGSSKTRQREREPTDDFEAMTLRLLEEAEEEQNREKRKTNNHSKQIQEVITETLFGTTGKTLRLLEGFSEQEISAAIEKYGSEVSIQELADSIVADRTAGTCIKIEPYSFTSDSNSSMAGSKFKSSSGGAAAVINPSFYSNLAIKTEEEHNRPVASQNKDLDIMEKLKGKLPDEEYAIDIRNSLKWPKPEIDDDLNSCSELAFPPEQRQGISKLLERQLNHKARRRESYGVPKLVKPSSCRGVDQMVAKAPLFFYGNVMNLSQDCWVKISQFLYAIEPEFVNTRFFSALSRKEGYLHNLPSENRFHIMPKSPMTIEDAMPHIKRHGPSWDTRKQLSCISSETIGVPQLCDRLRKVLVDSGGLLTAEQQKDLFLFALHRSHSESSDSLDSLFGDEKDTSRQANDPTVIHLKEEVSTETLFGTMDKTLRLLEVGFSEQEISAAIEKYGSEASIQELADSIVADRTAGTCIKIEPYSFPSDSNSSMAGSKFKSSSGGAEITLHLLGIHFKGLVTVEPSEAKRKIVKKWWQDSGQMGKYIGAG